MDEIVADAEILGQILIWSISSHYAQIVLVREEATWRVVDGEDVGNRVFVELRKVLAVSIISHV